MCICKLQPYLKTINYVKVIKMFLFYILAHIAHNISKSDTLYYILNGRLLDHFLVKKKLPRGLKYRDGFTLSKNNLSM